MIQIKRAAILLLSCIVLLFAGCGKSIKQRMTDAYANMANAKSMDLTISFGMGLRISSEGTTLPVQFQMKMETSMFRDPDKMKAKMSISVFGFSQAIGEMYMQTLEDGTIQVFNHESATDTWTINTDETGMMALNLGKFSTGTDMSIFKSMKVVGTGEVNGVEADIVECELDMDMLWDTAMKGMESELSGELGEDTESVIAGIKAAFSDAVYTVWLEKGGSQILKIKLDLSSLVSYLNEGLSDLLGESLLDSIGMEEEDTDGQAIPDIEFTDLYIEVAIDSINSSEPFEIPAEAYTSQPTA